MSSRLFVLFSLIAYVHSAAVNYTLDVNSDIDTNILRVLCQNYQQLENFTCSGVLPGIPVGQRRNTTGFWSTCDQADEQTVHATPCTLAYYRNLDSFVVKSIVLDAYHNGNNSLIRVRTSNHNDVLFNGSDSWGRHVIDASVYPDIESLDNILIFAETTSGFVVFDKVFMELDYPVAPTTAPPTNGTTQAPPTNGTTQAPPTNGTTQAPPTNGTTQAPPTNGTTQAPPTNGTTQAPPTNGTTQAPPTNMTTIRPPCNNSTQFACRNGNCIPLNFICDGYNDCGDNSDEDTDTCGVPPICRPDQFECANGICIPANYVCDGDNDCGDFSDERNCPCQIPGQIKCADGTCINPDYWCDGIIDCPDYSDETFNCTMTAIRETGTIVHFERVHKLSPGKVKLF
ncbi:uncharacterized protein LOC110848838 [Folsomia candida]|uniref:Basement membrane-specific heparan sulfate proteoglycan core protein n=1 Tax=Folsomia candida TaxID=158441 RepID=A0A226EFQ1_FOLCA|nr:uncharacterized protein LOC110848838 [Folsomia candida]OXA56372.1 Basement membrane-specific heparan sulfate proteoglycan core protein [Folsomia candida]